MIDNAKASLFLAEQLNIKCVNENRRPGYPVGLLTSRGK